MHGLVSQCFQLRLRKGKSTLHIRKDGLRILCIKGFRLIGVTYDQIKRQMFGAWQRRQLVIDCTEFVL